MRELRTQIEIKASPETVWGILTDFPRFPEWNPLMNLEGPVSEGSRLCLSLGSPGKKAMELRPTVTRVIPNRELRWLGRLVLPGIFDGEHIFEIEPGGNGEVRFVHRENFRGILVPLFWKRLDSEVRKGFEDMNEALKVQAESSRP
jgi:hypothetical protein